MRYYLGADLGATKSHLLIADETGRALGFALGGGANHEVVGYQAVTHVVRGMFRSALASAGLGPEDIAGAGLGVSGFDWQSEADAQHEVLSAAGLRGFPVTVVNDAVVGLLAGSSEGWGVGLVSGTGCNCWGVDRDQRYGRVLGLGARVGEFAGGAALVQRAIWAVAREATRRGPATQLSDALVHYTSARSLDDFLEGYCEYRLEVPPSAAPLVFEVATAGDPVAIECIAWAGRELGDLALGVIRQLGFERMTFDLVLIGSLFKGGPLLTDPLMRVVRSVAPGARAVPLMAPPVVGGVILAMRQAGLDVRDMNQRLQATTAELQRGHDMHDRTSEVQEVHP